MSSERIWVDSLNITDTTAAAAGVGAMVVAGGLAVAGDLWRGGTITSTNSTDSTTSSNGAVLAAGGAGFTSLLYVDGPLKSFSTNDATSSTTGAIQSLGAVDASKQIIAGTKLYYNASTASPVLLNQFSGTISLVGTTFLVGTAGSGFTTTGNLYYLCDDHETSIDNAGRLWVRVTWSSKGTTTGAITIAGNSLYAPVTLVGNSLTVGRSEGITYTGRLFARVTPTTGAIAFYDSALAGGAETQLVDTDFSATGTLDLCGSFMKAIL